MYSCEIWKFLGTIFYRTPTVNRNNLYCNSSVMTFIGNYGLRDQVLTDNFFFFLTDVELVFNVFYMYSRCVYLMKGRGEGVLDHIFVSLTAPLLKGTAQSKVCDIYFK